MVFQSIIQKTHLFHGRERLSYQAHLFSWQQPGGEGGYIWSKMGNYETKNAQNQLCWLTKHKFEEKCVRIIEGVSGDISPPSHLKISVSERSLSQHEGMLNSLLLGELDVGVALGLLLK